MTSFIISDARTATLNDVDDSTSLVVGRFGGGGSGVHEFIQPAGICGRPGGGYLIADRGNDRIVAIDDLDGTGWTTLGSSGGGNGQFSNPTAVAADSDGKIYITDWGNHRIVRLDAIDGTGWQAFGEPGRPGPGDPAIGKFARPTAITVDAQNRIYVADPAAGRVIRIDGIDGSGWTDAANDHGLIFNCPTGVTTVNSSVIVSELAARRITRFAISPAPAVEHFDATETPIPLAAPLAVSNDGAESVAVCDAIGRLLRLEHTPNGYQVAADLHLAKLGIEQPLGICRK